jgi:hypothetical protein
MYASMYVRTYVRMYVRMHVCMYVCMYNIYIYGGRTLRFLCSPKTNKNNTKETKSEWAEPDQRRSVANLTDLA